MTTRKEWLLTFCLVNGFTYAQTTVSTTPVVRTSRERIRLYERGERGNFSGIDKLPNPFRYTFEVPAEGKEMAVVSERDSAAFVLRRGVTTRFRIVREAKRDTILCEFTGVAPAATFNDAYIAAHKGKNFVEIPEVYELLNIVIAITPTGLTDKDLIPEKTPYYQQVLRHFRKYHEHPAVLKIDSALRQNRYSWLKMDAYAYNFVGERIVKSGVYDRVSWGDTNTLAPYVDALSDFARTATFQKFYAQHLPYYRQLIADYQSNVNIDRMKLWLEKQFPRTQYSSVKAIFSPLVAANQSANHFDNNGFQEAQMHINFPFVRDLRKTPNVLTQARRQEIAFTELNHSYLNPEADQYEMQKWLGDITKWTTNKTPSDYLNPYSCFCEYMNWALVTLYHSDHFRGSEFEQLRDGIDNRMVNGRGFVKFKEFDAELLRLYHRRKPGQTVADLYPAILDWVAKQ